MCVVVCCCVFSWLCDSVLVGMSVYMCGCAFCCVVVCLCVCLCVFLCAWLCNCVFVCLIDGL